MKSIQVFMSYAHEDEGLRARLDEHLCALRAKRIRGWHDRQIAAGNDISRTIDHHLRTAEVMALLISPSFIASSYCWRIERPLAWQRHMLGQATLIPVILRPCDWKKTSLAKLRVVPRDGKAVTTWRNRDLAFLDIEQEIGRVADAELKLRRAVLNGYDPMQDCESADDHDAWEWLILTEQRFRVIKRAAALERKRSRCR